MPLHHSHALPHYLAPAEVALYRLFALEAALSCPVGMGGCLSGDWGGCGEVLCLGLVTI